MTKVSKPRAKSATAVRASAPKAALAATPELSPVPVPEPVAETVAETARDVVLQPIEAAIPDPVAIEDTTMDTMNTASAKAQTLFTDINARAKSAMEKSAKAFEDATEFNKANVEAVVESAKIAAKGFETLGQDAADYGRRSFESATAAMKSLSSIKSPTDFFKLQSDFVRGAFDAMVAESSRSTEAMLKLAGEVAQPISNRAAVAVEKVKLAA